MTFELGKLHIKRNITSIILQNSNTKSVGYGVQNSFCARRKNNYDVSMSNHRRVPWGRATFCGGYYLLMDRPECATSPLGTSCTPYQADLPSRSYHGALFSNSANNLWTLSFFSRDLHRLLVSDLTIRQFCLLSRRQKSDFRQGYNVQWSTAWSSHWYSSRNS